MAEKPPYAPDTQNQTVSYKGVTWKGNPGSDWTMEGGASGASGGTGDINSYLSNYNKQVLGSLGANVVDANGVVNFSEIKSALTPSGGAPEALNRVQMYQDLRASQGVSDLESTLTNLKAAQMEVYGQLNINTAAERGKPVAQNVIEGRVSEQTRTAQENADFLSRQIATVTDQLNTSYNVINTYMNFAGLDYQDAVTRYNTEFTQNMSVLNLVQSTRSAGVAEYGTVTGIELQKQELALKQQQQEQDSARANLQIMMNAITSGNVTPDALSSDQKLQLTKLETQAGLPAGFTSNLGLSAKDKIIFTTTNNGVTQVGIQQADGTVSVKSYGTSTGGGGTAAQKEQAIMNDVARFAKAGADLKDVIATVNDPSLNTKIYQAYNANAANPSNASRSDLEKLGIKLSDPKIDPLTGQPYP